MKFLYLVVALVTGAPPVEFQEVGGKMAKVLSDKTVNRASSFLPINNKASHLKSSKSTSLVDYLLAAAHTLETGSTSASIWPVVRHASSPLSAKKSAMASFIDKQYPEWGLEEMQRFALDKRYAAQTTPYSSL
jgi:hypothetical protein